MPMCLVPGCTSGYASNTEKVHFFTIPKNEDMLNLWKTAIKRKDVFVKSGRAVCENHFNKSDILWQRYLFGPENQILGVSNYKVPRLRKGTVPSIFPWTEFPEAKEISKPTEKERCDATATDATVENSVSEESVFLSNQSQVLFNEPDSAIDEPISFLFDDLLGAEIQLPLGWLRQTTYCKGIQFLIFLIINVIEIENSYEPVILKSITVKNDLSITINILGQQLNVNSFEIPSYVKSIEELQNSIKKIHRLTICQGCTMSSTNFSFSEIKCKQLRKDSSTWRHIECPLLLFQSKICDRCKKTKNALRKYLARSNVKKIQ